MLFIKLTKHSIMECIFSIDYVQATGYLFLCAEFVEHFFNLAMPVFLDFPERLVSCRDKL